jgi:hypothetical protein
MRCSLYFKLDNNRYLFGLTYSLTLDTINVSKLKINYLVLPTNPYIINISVFMWNLHVNKSQI